MRCNVSHLVGRNGQLEAWGAWKQPRAHAYLGETMSQPENDKTAHEGLRHRPRGIYSWRSRSWVTPSHRPPSSKTPGFGADQAKRGPGLVSVHLAEQGSECPKPSWLCRGQHGRETIILQPVQVCRARCDRKYRTRWGQRSLGSGDQPFPVSSSLRCPESPLPEKKSKKQTDDQVSCSPAASSWPQLPRLLPKKLCFPHTLVQKAHVRLAGEGCAGPQQLEGVLTRRRGAGVQCPPVATKQPCPGAPLASASGWSLGPRK